MTDTLKMVRGSSYARRIVVGFSGGVTSAWCAGWALRNFPRDEVDLLWHDTKEEHDDTYRFLAEMAKALDKPIVERSDGRSVTELFRDEGFLGNNQNAMCSRILKVEQGDRYFDELRSAGVDEIVKVFGFSAREPVRVQRASARARANGYGVRFPVVEERVTKQDCVDWCFAQGVKPSAMYCWSEHANCVGLQAENASLRTANATLEAELAEAVRLMRDVYMDNWRGGYQKFLARHPEKP